MKVKYEVTRDALVEAFTRWEADYREHPHSYAAGMKRYDLSVDQHGEALADYLISLLIG